MSMKIFCGILLALAFFAVPASASETSAAPDETLPFELYKFEGAQFYAKKRVKLAKHELEKSLTATGRVLTLIYTLSGDHSPLEVAENYKQNLLGQGFSLHAEREQTSSGQVCWNDQLRDVCYKSSIYGQTNILQMKKGDGNDASYIHLIVAQAKDAIKGKPEDPTKKLPDMVLSPGDQIIILRVITPQPVKNQMIKENMSFILGQLKATGRVDLYGIYFDVDKAVLKPESNAVLGEIVKALKEDVSLKLQIGGHTDNSGSEAHNLTLSEGRAGAVVAALITQGVETGRLTAKGHGASQPVATNDTEEGRAKNRRVELAKL